MTQANGNIATKLSSIINTMEILANDLGRISTDSFEATMNTSKVNAVKAKRDVVLDRLGELHSLMLEAALSSSDNDVVARSGGGGGKG